ncbi:hypothetical protein TNCV_4396611 [Trichonephila clavipes]|uniref:Uncharacterized protein n=1 Tax=Trichonephila clavipes TaxID=2585209 RepID=A0A8X6W546_TRICX|nr:hypothetical protein TNCV_4396611 [Trichonephila clavipes]
MRLFWPVLCADANRTRVWHLKYAVGSFMPKTPVQHLFSQLSPGGQGMSPYYVHALYTKPYNLGLAYWVHRAWMKVPFPLKASCSM